MHDKFDVHDLKCHSTVLDLFVMQIVSSLLRASWQHTSKHNFTNLSICLAFCFNHLESVNILQNSFLPTLSPLPSILPSIAQQLPSFKEEKQDFP